MNKKLHVHLTARVPGRQ